jgi:alcohol dehydrogenase YqhD (iron-dependent ADH family)
MVNAHIKNKQVIKMTTFASKSSKKYLNKFVFAIGGGSVIDEAKIYAKKHKKFAIALPITGAGATETTHAVIWGKTKQNVKTKKPITISPPFKVKLPQKARLNTCCDMIGHLVDYLNVCSDNELVEVGIYLGSLIEKHPTNLTHKRSYPLTLNGMPHGEAVGRILQELGILK